MDRPVRRALASVLAAVLAIGLLAGGAVAPVAGAGVPGAVTWTVDHKAHTITAHVQLQIYSGCSGDPLGTAADKALACAGVRSQVTQFLADKIKGQAEGIWNQGYRYRCYRFVLSVDVKLAQERGDADDDRIVVQIDPSFAGIRDHVGRGGGDGKNWSSNDPADSMVPSHQGTTWGEQSQLETAVYAHEIGHILGLDDAYHDVRDARGNVTSSPNQGAPDDLMSRGTATNVDQATINRVVERNQNNLRDTKGQPVALKDLVCPEFMATLSGKEIYHLGNLFSYTTDRLCGGGQTVSSSQDQTVAYISDEVHVDAVKLLAPNPAWPGLDVLLVPHGKQPEQIDLGIGPNGFLDPITLFQLPAAFSVDRSNAKPGVAPMPSKNELGYQPCAGGGGAGKAQNDCGHRDYRAAMEVTLSNVNVLFPLFLNAGANTSALYTSCEGPDPVPGGFVLDGLATISGGAVPVDKLLDPTVDQVDIGGSATYTQKELGHWTTIQYDWLLILCRIRDGVPAC